MKNNPKSILFLAAAAVTVLNFQSCGKYEDGPSFSLRTKKARLTGEWELVKINGKEENKYFSSKSHRILLNQPLVLSQRKSEIDIICTVVGGGLSGQAGAIRHGIARALVKFEPDLRKNLKSKGLLTRDSRIVERKKYGKAKARRSYQFSKR